MSDFAPISPGSFAPAGAPDSVRSGPVDRRRVAEPAPTIARPIGERLDRVELSDRAILLNQLRDLPDVRAELVADARARIAESEDFPSVDDLDPALDALARDLDLLA